MKARRLLSVCVALVLLASVEGNWRLPNVREMQSLVDYGRYYPALPSGHPFTDVRSNLYWTSTSSADRASVAWYVELGFGIVDDNVESNPYYVWPVRG